MKVFSFKCPKCDHFSHTRQPAHNYLDLVRKGKAIQGLTFAHGRLKHGGKAIRPWLFLFSVLIWFALYLEGEAGWFALSVVWAQRLHNNRPFKAYYCGRADVGGLAWGFENCRKIGSQSRNPSCSAEIVPECCGYWKMLCFLFFWLFDNEMHEMLKKKH